MTAPGLPAEMLASSVIVSVTSSSMITLYMNVRSTSGIVTSAPIMYALSMMGAFAGSPHTVKSDSLAATTASMAETRLET